MLTEYRAPIELVQNIINCRYGVALPYYGLVSSSHIYTEPDVSRRLRDYDNRAYQEVGPSTGSMVSWLTSSSNFCLIFSLTLNVRLSTFGQWPELINQHEVWL